MLLVHLIDDMLQNAVILCRPDERVKDTSLERNEVTTTPDKDENPVSEAVSCCMPCNKVMQDGAWSAVVWRERSTSQG